MVFLFLAVVVLAVVFFWGLRGLGEKVEELRDEVDSLRRAVRSLNERPAEKPVESDARLDIATETDVTAAIEHAPLALEPAAEAPTPDVFALKPPIDSGMRAAALVEKRVSAGPPALPPPLPRPRAAAAPRESLGDVLLVKLKKIGPNDPNLSWEQALGTYWIPRIAIVFIVIGIVFSLTLALQKWGPPVRIGLGYGVCAALLGIGWRLESKYPAYARVLYSGGFALSYFVTFGTYFIPFARVFDTPVFTLAALGAIVLAWGGVAQRRKSKTVAVMVTCLGHLTIGVTSFSVGSPGPYSVLGIVLLSAGSAFFLLRNRWYYVAALGLLGSYTNHFLLMTQSQSAGTVTEFSVGISVLTAYFLVFALSELFAPESLRREQVPVWFRTLFASANTVGFLVLGSISMIGYEFTRDDHHIFRYVLAGTLAALAIVYWRRKNADPLLNVYATKAVAIASFGLAYQFSGATLTVWLAIEAVTLLVSARRSGLVVTRLLALAVAALTFVHGLYAVSTANPLAYSDPGFAGRAFQAVAVFLAYLAASLLYERTDWTSRSPAQALIGRRLSALWWRLDLLSAPPDDGRAHEKPLGGLLFPYLYSAGATVLFLVYAVQLMPLADSGVATVAACAVLAVAAVLLVSPPFGRVSVALGLVSAEQIYALTQGVAFEYGDANHRAMVVKTAAVVLILFVFAEYARRFGGSRRENQPFVFPPFGYLPSDGPVYWARITAEAPPVTNTPLLSFVVSAAALLLYSVGVFELTEAGHRALAFGSAAAVMAMCAWGFKALHFGAASVLFFAMGIGTGTFEIGPHADSSLQFAALGTMLFAALACEKRVPGGEIGLAYHRAPVSPNVLYCAWAWLLALFLAGRLDAAAEVYALIGAAIGACVLMNVLHTGAWAYAAAGLAVFAHLRWQWSVIEVDAYAPRVPALALLAVTLGIERYLALFAVRRTGPVLIVAAWLLSLHFGEIESSDAYLAAAWTIAALGFLGYGIVFRSLTAGVLAALAGLFASGAQFIFALDEKAGAVALMTGFLSPAAFWILCERLAARKRTEVPGPWATAILVALPTALLMEMLRQMPVLGEYLVTISWSLFGVLLFGVSLMFRQPFYRYSGLVVMLIASVRVIAVDTRELEALPRIAAWTGLGTVLLVLGYGYVKAFARTGGVTKHGPATSAPGVEAP